MRKPQLFSSAETEWQQGFQRNEACACYRLPHGEVQFISGTVVSKLKKGESGFAFVKFNGKRRFIVTPAMSHELRASRNTPSHHTPYTIHHTPRTKSSFKTYINAALQKITAQKVEKIVTARISAGKKPLKFSTFQLFKKACKKYPSTFCSIVFIPGEGIWIGATPEILVEEKGDQLITYALAGTIATKGKAAFTAKERKEQQLVSGFIEKKLRKFSDQVNISATEAASNASLAHLRTVFSIPRAGIEPLNLAKALHPTPAVAGLPRKKALKFIAANEKLDRQFYSGYLGPVNHNNTTSLWVNLRCVEVTEKQLRFYAGCGITTGSIAEKEWEETERKVAVMRSLI